MNIYVNKHDQQLGPFSEDQLRQAIAQGRFSPTDLAWVEGASDWKPISDLIAVSLPPRLPQPPPSVPSLQPPQNSPKGLIIASWIMIGLTCLVSLIPGVGFITWLIAAPVLLVTFILGIVALTKGGTLQGILILLTSLIAAPLFIVIAPIVTTAGAVAAADATASGASVAVDNSKEAAGAANSASPTELERRLTIGDTVKFVDSEWEVINARELGSILSGNDFVEPKRTEGKFVYVRYKVKNNTGEQQAVLFTPALQDGKGRKYEELDDLEMYLGQGETGMTVEQLPSGLPKTFSAIFEVPSDANAFMFMTRSFAPFRAEEKGVSLGF